MDHKQLTGVYRHDLYGDLTISRCKNSLQVRFGPRRITTLRHWQDDVFEADFPNPMVQDWHLTFQVTEDSSVASARVVAAPWAPAWFEDKADLGEFVRVSDTKAPDKRLRPETNDEPIRMEQNFHSLTIATFQQERAGEVVGWPSNIREANAWAGTGVTFPVTTHQLLGWHADPDVHPFAGHHAGQLIAYGELWVDPSEDEVEFARVIVRPEHRNEGIGRAFVRQLAAQAMRFSLRNIIIRVAAENERAIRCYQSAGFVRLSES